MKKLKYISVLSVILSVFAFSCNEDSISPLRTGDDEDDDPVETIPPPPPPTQGTVIIDTLTVG